MNCKNTYYVQQNPYRSPLYMYFRMESARRFMETHALKLTDYKRCNDPFDCCYDIIFNGTEVTKNDELRTKFVDPALSEYKFACFSTIDNSTLMWAYYAESQRGVCIEFAPDIDPIAFSDLQYVSYKNKWHIINEQWQESDIIGILTTKATCWAHENEVRLIKKGLTTGLLALNPLSIRSIILGCQTEHFYDDIEDTRQKELERLLELLKRPEYEHVVIKQISIDNKYNLQSKKVHSIIWQENEETVITSLFNQHITIKRYLADRVEIIYKAFMQKWETVRLFLTNGHYYIESNAIRGYLDFLV